MIPGTGNATLTFYLYTQHASVAYGATDKLEVSLDGVALSPSPIFANDVTYQSGYTLVTIDVSAYADGNAHVLKFETTQTGSAVADDITNFFIDRISIRTGTNFTGNWGIDLTPSILNFGFVGPGQSATRTVKVINTGSTPLVGTATAKAPFFVTSNANYDIPPGGTDTVEITFAPVDAETYRRDINFSGGGGLDIIAAGNSVHGVVSPSNVDVIINEVAPWNTSGITDEDGDHSDWIELYNRNEVPILLDGWTIEYTPDGGTPTTWTFPDGITIGRRDYLLVWASNKAGQGLLAKGITNEGEDYPLVYAYNSAAGSEYGRLRSDFTIDAEDVERALAVRVTNTNARPGLDINLNRGAEDFVPAEAFNMSLTIGIFSWHTNFSLDQSRSGTLILRNPDGNPTDFSPLDFAILMASDTSWAYYLSQNAWLVANLSTPVRPNEIAHATEWTVILDPGHGKTAIGSGANTGVSGTGTKGIATNTQERLATWLVAQQVKERIEQWNLGQGKQITVIITKLNSEENISLVERAQQLGNNNAKLLLSIHFDGAVLKNYHPITNPNPDQTFAIVLPEKWVEEIPEESNRWLYTDNRNKADEVAFANKLVEAVAAVQGTSIAYLRHHEDDANKGVLFETTLEWNDPWVEWAERLYFRQPETPASGRGLAILIEIANFKNLDRDLFLNNDITSTPIASRYRPISDEIARVIIEEITQ